MLKSLAGTIKPKAGYRLSFYSAKPPLARELGDSFEVRVHPGKISPELFVKVHKAMRSQVESKTYEGHAELLQRLTPADLDKLKELDKKIAVKAYLEGVYVAERYCVLANPQNSPNKINAERIMSEYRAYIRHHHKDHDFNEELAWIIKDYEAGTAGEDIRADAALLKRGRRFFRHIRAIDYRDGVENSWKKIENVIKSDINPLAAFIALRRVFFAESPSSLSLIKRQ